MIGTGSWRAALVAVDDAQKRADRPCPGRRTARSSSACRLPRLPRRQAPIFRNANPTPLRCLWLDDRRGLRRKHRDANSASPPQARHRAPVGCARRNLGLVVFGPGAHSQCENIDLKLTPGPNRALGRWVRWSLVSAGPIGDDDDRTALHPGPLLLRLPDDRLRF